jgi:hypothetical protein
MKTIYSFLIVFSTQLFGQVDVKVGQPVEVKLEANAEKTIGAITELIKEIKDNKPIVISKSTSGSIAKIKAEEKLVVSTIEVAASAVKRFQNRDKIAGKQIGDHLLIASTNKYRLQYYIPLEEISAEDFDFDHENFLMRISVPKPVLDKKMASVDPSDITTEWLSSGIAPYTEAAMQKMINDLKDNALRDEAIRQASSGTIEHVIQQAGKIAVENFVRKMFMNGKILGNMSWMRIEIVYK